jgi:hypothetical protein
MSVPFSYLLLPAKSLFPLYKNYRSESEEMRKKKEKREMKMM